MKTIRHIVILVQLLLLALPGFAEKKKPNIIFILADDLGFADLGFTGSDLHQTPNLDNLAKNSMYFNNAYASHPTCQPSRLSLLTGKYPARIGAVSHGDIGGVSGQGIEIPSKEVTLGEAFQEGGYLTCHIGKWHVGIVDNGPTKNGFDFEVVSNDFCCPGSYFYPYKSDKHKDHRDQLAAVPDLEDQDPNDHLTKAVTDKAIDFINERKDEQVPFFMNLWYYAVHTPIQSDKDKVEKYKKLIKPENRHRNPRYAALVEHLDDGVGRVLDAVDEAGIADNTIIIFFSDNGGATYLNITDNYPLRGGKGSQYEGGYRVPMLVKWPGTTKGGTVCEEKVIATDFYPTLLKMAGIKGDRKHNKKLDGVDITGLFEDPSSKLQDRSLHWLKYLSLIHYNPEKLPERNWPSGTMIKGDWKIREIFEMPAASGIKHQFFLYNLKDDPSETTDLAAEYPEKIEELKKEMYKWRRDVKAPKFDLEGFYGL